MDDRLFRDAMGKFATGVTVVAVEDEGSVHGMTANAFMSVSLNPKLVVVSIAEKARSLEKIKRAKKFSVSILSAEQQEMSAFFAGQIRDGREVQFERLDGQPVIPGALAQVACEVVSEHVEGDHTLFIGRVTDIRLNEGEPLIFFGGKYRYLKELQPQN